jgi:DNA-binding MarR family transcriptional regulator
VPFATDLPTPWTVLTSAKRTSVALERRADALLRARALDLTQLRLLVDIDDRHSAWAAQVSRDLSLSRQAVAHHLARLSDRGVVHAGPPGGYVRGIRLTAEGRELAARGLDDLAPLLDRLAAGADLRATASALMALEAATRPPPPRWQL